MRFAIDTNIIIYVEGLNDVARRDKARQLMLGLQGLPTIVPVQVLAEALNVLIRKGKFTPKRAIAMLQPWHKDYTLQASTPEIFMDALQIVERHAFGIWDAVILAAASFSGARTLFSEDMQNGFSWKGTMIVNPFLPNPAPIVRALLSPE
jgi:predicted nucleic acid-binding protein